MRTRRNFGGAIKVALIVLTAVLASQAWTYLNRADEPRVLTATHVPAVIVGGRVQQLPTADYLTIAEGTQTGEIDATGVVTATATSGTVNNWDPTGGSPGNLNGLFLARESPTAALTLTGMIAGNSHQLFMIRNTSVTAADTITINNENTSSTAANRFTLTNAASCSISAGASATFRYSLTATRWEPIDNGCVPTLTTLANSTITVTDTGTQDNYNPTGFSSATLIRSTGASTLTIDGFVGGQDGRVLYVCATSQNVILAAEAAGSTAANRIWPITATGAPTSISLNGGVNGNTCAELIYDGTSSRWRVVAANMETFNAPFQTNSTDTAAGGISVTGGQMVLSTATGHISTVGATTPVLSSCGATPSPTIHGSDIFGKYTTGGTATTCTLTFGATYTNPPSCIVTPEGITTLPTYTTSATAITVTVDVAQTTYNYHCIKVQ